MLTHLHSLTFLTLSYNNIQYLALTVFGDMPNLQQLSLAFNSINYVGNSEFMDFKSLVLLSLLSNKISYIDPNIVQGSNKLVRLCLGNNLFPETFSINTSKLTSINTLAIFSPTCSA